MTQNDYKTERIKISRLIYRVLAENLHVREAILKFPKDIEDPTIKATYHALVHYEADEDLRWRDLSYKEEQDDFLEFIAQILQNGDALPENVIKSYNKYYKDTYVNYSDSVKGFLRRLCRFLNV